MDAIILYIVGSSVKSQTKEDCEEKVEKGLQKQHLFLFTRKQILLPLFGTLISALCCVSISTRR